MKKLLLLLISFIIMLSSCDPVVDDSSTKTTSYKISYDSNGADSGTAPAEQTKTSGSDITLAANTGSLAKTGCNFYGWNTSADGSGTDYAAGSSYTADADLTLFAKWATETFTVSGTITFPAAVESKTIYLCVDTDSNGDNGFAQVIQKTITVDASDLTYNYSIPGVAPGTYYVYSLVDMDGSGGGLGPGDYFGSYNLSSMTQWPLSSANVKVTADTTIDMTLLGYQISSSTTTYSVSGTITFPATVTSKTIGVIFDTNTNGGDGIYKQLTDTVTGSSYDYTVTGIEAGSYYIYAVVDNNDSGMTSIDDVDYFGAYAFNATSAVVTDGGTNQFNFTLSLGTP